MTKTPPSSYNTWNTSRAAGAAGAVAAATEILLGPNTAEAVLFQRLRRFQLSHMAGESTHSCGRRDRARLHNHAIGMFKASVS